MDKSVDLSKYKVCYILADKEQVKKCNINSGLSHKTKSINSGFVWHELQLAYPRIFSSKRRTT